MSILIDDQIPSRKKRQLEPLNKKGLIKIKTMKSLPKISELLNFHETLEEQLLEHFSKDFLKKLPKECLYKPSQPQNPLMFLDLLTMNPLESSETLGLFSSKFKNSSSLISTLSDINYLTEKDIYNTEKTMNFLSPTSEKTIINTITSINSLKCLICLPIMNNNANYRELRYSLDSIYENIDVFRSIGVHEEEFSVLVFFNGFDKISLNMRETLFQEIDLKSKIPYVYSLEARIRNYLSDYEHFQKKQDLRMPLDSCYIYEMDYKPENSQKDYYMKVLLAVKMQEINGLDVLNWLIKGFSIYFQPEFIGFLSFGAALMKKALWNAYLSLDGEKKLGGIYGFQVPRIDCQTQEYDKFSKIVYKIIDFKKFQVFQDILDQVFDENYGEQIFGIYRFEALKIDGNENFCDVMEKKLKFKSFMGIDFNKVLGLELSCNYPIKVMENVEVSFKTAENLEELMNKKKQSFSENWLLFNSLSKLFLSRVYNNKKFTIFTRFFLIFQFMSQYFSIIKESMTISFCFSVLYIITNLFFKGFVIESFKLFNLQIISIAYFLILLCSLFHMSFFFKPEENPSDFQLISILFSILYNGFICVFLWKIPVFFENDSIFGLLLYSTIIGYYVFPIILYWKYSKRLIKAIFSYIWHKYLTIYLGIYCMTSFRDEFSNENSIFFEKMIIIHVIFALVIIIINSNEEISKEFVKIYLILYAIWSSLWILRRIIRKILEEILLFMEGRRSKNQVFSTHQFNKTEIVTS